MMAGFYKWMPPCGAVLLAVALFRALLRAGGRRKTGTKPTYPHPIPPEVFTAEFINGLPQMNRFGNSIVVRLCRDQMASNVSLRSAIESWFQRVDTNDRAGMLARLRSTDDGSHLSAFFELALQNFFESSGLVVQKEPVLQDGTTPDFRLVSGVADAYVEVRTIMMDERAHRAEKLMTDALLQIDKLSTKYVLSVHFESDPEAPTKPSLLRECVRQWLTHVSIAVGERETETLNAGGYQIEITASHIAGLVDGAGKVMFWSDPVKFLGNSLGLMRRGIKKKAAKYRDLQKAGKPYVVAICSTDPNFVLEDIWMTLAAYGTLGEESNDHGTFVLSGEQPKSPGLSGLLHCMLFQDRDSFAIHTRYLSNPAASSAVPEEFGWNKTRE